MSEWFIFVTLDRTFEHLSAFENAIERYQNYARLSTVDPPTKCHNGVLGIEAMMAHFYMFSENVDYVLLYRDHRTVAKAPTHNEKKAGQTVNVLRHLFQLYT